MAQADRILNYMKRHENGITQREAIYLGCYRLSARIWDMKKAGHVIATEVVEVPSTDGSIARIARYRLIKEKVKKDVSTRSNLNT